MKTTVIVGAIVIVLLSTLYVVLPPKPADAPAVNTTASSTATTTTDIATSSTSTGSDSDTTTSPIPGKLKAANFTGTLEKVDTSCFSDGECYVTIDNKKVTLLVGRRQEEVGSIVGVPSIGDLEAAIGAKVEVYSKDNLDGTYTLYGSKGFYVKVLSPLDTVTSGKPVTSTGKCVVGGCSSQLCVDEAKADMATNCMWSEQYACYKTAECKRQTTGECGWTETTELKACIAKAS